MATQALVKAPDGSMHKVVTDADRQFMAWWKREPHDKDPLSIPNFLRHTATERKESWDKHPPKHEHAFETPKPKPDSAEAYIGGGMTVAEVVAEQRKRIAFQEFKTKQKAKAATRPKRDRSHSAREAQLLVLLAEPNGVSLQELKDLTGRSSPSPMISVMRIQGGHNIQTGKRKSGETFWFIPATTAAVTTPTPTKKSAAPVKEKKHAAKAKRKGKRK